MESLPLWIRLLAYLAAIVLIWAWWWMYIHYGILGLLLILAFISAVRLAWAVGRFLDWF